MKEELLQIPAELVKAETMAHKSLKLIFNTQQNLTDEQYAKIMDKHEKLGWLSFLPGEVKIDPIQVKDLPDMVEEPERKSLSQQLYAVMYVWHTKKGGSEENFPVFRETQMRAIINQIKEKIDQYEEEKLPT